MTTYERYRSFMRKIADLNYASAVLNWDQECYMPEGGAAFRAQQLSTLAGMAHDLCVSDELGECLAKLEKESNLTAIERKNVEWTMKDFRRHKRYTTVFVEEMSHAVSEAFQSWQKAKEQKKFSLFAPRLEKLLDLKRKECELLGYKDHPYDAMLDLYEPGATTAGLNKLFGDVRKELVGFVREINSCPPPEDAFMFRTFAKDKQWDFGLTLLKQMGFDFNSGRQDISSHPFTTNFSPQDVRVTTRINEKDLHEMIWSCVHEGGHALYEQGLPEEQYGLPCGEYISLGIHESQSRLWENNVGRSLAYWRHHFPRLKELFPLELGKVNVVDFYKAMNLVKPSLIRTSADELTYHFHVMVRFEIEKELIEGKLKVSDLPDKWNARYMEYLGVKAENDSLGVLQDIHWSHGSFGYFPTYSLGSFYAAQFFRQACKEIIGLEKKIEDGNLNDLLNWLREKIHRHGKFFTASELCLRITGEELNFKYFMEYARKKYGEIYELRSVSA
ncbi:MAG: carboxypeptidase M32 [Bacteroidia bacterium]|nr:carboxypeptidase M32 [Bacteroidia bacterium]